MKSASGGSQVFRFGTFELDVRAGEIRKQGVRIKLPEQPLRILELLELGRVGDRRRVDLDLAGFGAGLRYLGKYLTLLRRVPLHRLDEVRNQVGTTLVLVLHV